MFNPPEELHVQFDQALIQIKAGLGKEHSMIIAGKDNLPPKNSRTAPRPIPIWS